MDGKPDLPAGLGAAPGAGTYPLQPGQVVDGFRLEEKLHQGGMATLWRVRRVGAQGPGSDSADVMPLIMKLPLTRAGEDAVSLVGFEVESMILPMLGGPHVPALVAKGDFTRQPYIVMEHIAGTSLKARFDAAPLGLDEVADLGVRVATALHALHRQHLVHLDVKPSNFLERPDGTVVVVDFGLSRHAQLPDLLEEELVLPMGTGPYMAPEQVQFVRGDARSDIFALGVMLYQFTTGERPFGAPTSVRGLRRRLVLEPVPPRALRPDCPPWLQEVILKCLEVSPSQRYQSAAQLAMALQDPVQVPLTQRAHKLRRSGAYTHLKRWFQALGHAPEASLPSVQLQLQRHPIILVAVDLQDASAALLDPLRESARRLLLTEPGARLACACVMRTARTGKDETAAGSSQSLHLNQLVKLKHWARPIQQSLKLDDGRLTFHVLDAPDAAAAIIDFAHRNGVDHIVMGARGNSVLRRYLGSVSSQVVAQADCSVTVVRAAPR